MPKRLIILLFFVPILASGQSHWSKARTYFDNFRYIKARLELDSIKTPTGIDSFAAEFFHLRGRINVKLNLDASACDDLLKARSIFLKLGANDTLIQGINLELANTMYSVEDNVNDVSELRDAYVAFAEKSNNPLYLARANKMLGNLSLAEENYKSAITKYNKSIRYSRLAGDSLLTSSCFSNLSIIYSDRLYKPDSALFYVSQAQRFIPRDRPDEMVFSLINQSSALRQKDMFPEARKALQLADSLLLTEFRRNTKSLVYLYLSEVDAELGLYPDAYKYLLASNQLRDSIAEEIQPIALNDVQTKYKVQEKELESLRFQILTYGISGLLLVVVIGSIIIYKNIARKRKLAEQEKLIETQALQNTINEQELQHIDKMLETQEKERQRIADELHDDLGGMLATLKLNISHLETKLTTESDAGWLDRTNDLLDQTYQRVRNISHLKNLGVAADQGLLQSINRMALKVTIPGKLAVNVIPFGLTDRLENNTEITLFRIIMELCTNVLKHADASEINIYLNQHEDQSLNILIEDNGKGFDAAEVFRNDGIGLKNIEKKIEFLGGTFTVDSTIGSGTTVIIDLPI